MFRRIKKKLAWWLIRDLFEEGVPYIKVGRKSVEIRPNAIKFDPLTSDPALEPGLLWYRGDFAEWRYSSDGSSIETLAPLTLVCRSFDSYLCTESTTETTIKSYTVPVPSWANRVLVFIRGTFEASTWDCKETGGTGLSRTGYGKIIVAGTTLASKSLNVGGTQSDTRSEDVDILSDFDVASLTNVTVDIRGYVSDTPASSRWRNLRIILIFCKAKQL